MSNHSAKHYCTSAAPENKAEASDCVMERLSMRTLPTRYQRRFGSGVAKALLPAIPPGCIPFRFQCRFNPRAVLWGDPVGSWSKKAALVCLLLTLWSAWIFVAHHHTSDLDAAQCDVCMAARSAVPQASATLLTTTFVVFSTVRVEPVSIQQRVAIFALSVRPPPAV